MAGLGQGKGLLRGEHNSYAHPVGRGTGRARRVAAARGLKGGAEAKLDWWV